MIGFKYCQHETGRYKSTRGSSTFYRTGIKTTKKLKAGDVLRPVIMFVQAFETLEDALITDEAERQHYQRELQIYRTSRWDISPHTGAHVSCAPPRARYVSP